MAQLTIKGERSAAVWGDALHLHVNVEQVLALVADRADGEETWADAPDERAREVRRAAEVLRTPFECRHVTLNDRRARLNGHGSGQQQQDERGI